MHRCRGNGVGDFPARAAQGPIASTLEVLAETPEFADDPHLLPFRRVGPTYDEVLGYRLPGESKQARALFGVVMPGRFGRAFLQPNPTSQNK